MLGLDTDAQSYILGNNAIGRESDCIAGVYSESEEILFFIGESDFLILSKSFKALRYLVITEDHLVREQGC